MNDYIKKLESEKHKEELALMKSSEKYNYQALSEENKQLKQMIEVFQINIKNLLEDNLKFKNENERLEKELKNFTSASVANEDAEKDSRKTFSQGKAPLKKKVIGNNNKKSISNLDKNDSIIKRKLKEEKNYNEDNEDSNTSLNNKTSSELKNKLKSSIIDKLTSDNDLYKNKKDLEELQK